MERRLREDSATVHLSRPVVSTRLCGAVCPLLVCVPEPHHHTACVSVTRGPEKKEHLLFTDLPLAVSQTHICPLTEAHSQDNVIWGKLP